MIEYGSALWQEVEEFELDKDAEVKPVCCSKTCRINWHSKVEAASVFS